MERFKVGEKVRILEGTKQKGWCSDGSMKKYIGTKGVIINNYAPKDKLAVILDLDNNYRYFNKEDLEKVENIDKMKEFTKSDLKEFDEVVFRNGNKNVFYQNGFRGEHGRYIKYYKENLLRDDDVKEFDIMQVIRNNEVIWERIEKSPLQIELESLEQQQREIADKIAELSKKCN